MNKKSIAILMAAGALAASTAASAQDLGSILSGIFGGGSSSVPAVVAGTAQGPIYTDASGRQFQYDQYGRQVYLTAGVQQSQVYTDAYGRQFQYDQYGRQVYLNGTVQPGVVQPGVTMAPGGHLISRFYLAQGAMQPGSEAVFVLVGQPGGIASVTMPSGIRVNLVERQPGYYEGRYVVQWNDNVQAMSQVFGALQVGSTTTTTPLENRGSVAGIYPGAQSNRRWPW